MELREDSQCNRNMLILGSLFKQAWGNFSAQEPQPQILSLKGRTVCCQGFFKIPFSRNKNEKHAQILSKHNPFSVW